MSQPVNEIIHDLDFGEYIKRPGINPSAIVHGRKSMRHLDRYLKGLLPINKEGAGQKNLAFGSIIHDLALENKSIRSTERVAFYPGKVRRGKEWDAFKAEHAGKRILLQSWEREAEECCSAGIEALHENETARQLLETDLVEVSIFADINGVQCKGGADGIVHDGDYFDLFDLKTCRDAETMAFGRVAANLGYCMKMACYANFYAQVTGKILRDIYFIALDLVDFDTVVYPLHESSIEQGWRRARKIIDQYRECQQEHYCPDCPMFRNCTCLTGICPRVTFSIGKGKKPMSEQLDRHDNYEALFDKAYLRWFHLGENGALIEITGIKKEDLILPGGAAKKAPVITYKVMKGDIEKPIRPLVLNKTNAEIIASILGPKPSQWKGGQVVLYPTTTQIFKQATKKMETVGCIRVREAKGGNSE